jgi:hypothetical protein
MRHIVYSKVPEFYEEWMHGRVYGLNDSEIRVSSGEGMLLLNAKKILGLIQPPVQ